jgi:hypothetical protein
MPGSKEFSMNRFLDILKIVLPPDEPSSPSGIQTQPDGSPVPAGTLTGPSGSSEPD